MAGEASPAGLAEDLGATRKKTYNHMIEKHVSRKMEREYAEIIQRAAPFGEP